MNSKHICILLTSLTATGGVVAADRPIDGIMDNSFFVEEAYNQEPGVVQHIFTGLYSHDRVSGSNPQSYDFSFTQEWPLLSQKHQLSYTVPYSYVRTGGRSDHGVGDVLLNYRYQAWFDEKSLCAFAPRFSLVLPTGDDAKGFGDNSWGYQWNLPFSTAVGDRWFFHANAGLTFLPNAGAAPRQDLLNYNFGASLIYGATADLHFLLEWVGNSVETITGTARTERDFGSLISPGVRHAINFPSGAQMVLGLAAPIGLSRSVPEYGAFVYLSFEHGFLSQ